MFGTSRKGIDRASRRVFGKRLLQRNALVKEVAFAEKSVVWASYDPSRQRRAIATGLRLPSSISSGKCGRESKTCSVGLDIDAKGDYVMLAYAEIELHAS